jgi:hypothetical protein
VLSVQVFASVSVFFAYMYVYKCYRYSVCELDIHGSMHHDIIFTKMTDMMQLCGIIYCSLTALHVSSDIFAHYQEHLDYLQFLVLFPCVVVGCSRRHTGIKPSSAEVMHE